jgi:hypothetical protein
MTAQEQDTFLDYLRSIEDELLEAVTADYVWLVETDDEQPVSRFYWRRGACLEECSRRGMQEATQDSSWPIFCLADLG